MAKTGNSVAKAVVAAVVTPVLVETVRQIGTGVREHLKRRKEAKKRAEPVRVASTKPEDPSLVDTLVALGFTKDEAKRAVESPEVLAAKTHPFGERVRIALRVLKP